VFKNKKLNSLAQLLVFSVTDTGIGIPEDKLGIIFEAFQQADGSNQKKIMAALAWASPLAANWRMYWGVKSNWKARKVKAVRLNYSCLWFLTQASWRPVRRWWR